MAALAGVPAPVIKMARQYLVKLEKETVRRHPQRDLFSDATAASLATGENWENRQTRPQHPVFTLLRTVVPDELSPKQALETIYALKKAAEKE